MSSFDFDPDSQQQQSALPPPPERIGRLNLTVLGVFVLLGIVWGAWGPLSNAAKTAWGRHCAREARTALDAQDWGRAVEQTIAARRWAPDDVEVIRMVIEFFKVSGSDPAGLVQQLRSLAEKQPLAEDEQLLLGRTLAATGKTTEAREVYNRLPPDSSMKKPALELLSAILSQEGHTDEAREVANRATRKRPGTPEARLKIALEDLKSAFVEMRRHAHAELLELARLEAALAMEAATHLTVSPLLTVAEAEELLHVIESHAHKSLPVRLGVVSALMRLRPERREALLDVEIKRFKSGDDGALEHITRWLALEKQHARVLQLVPGKLRSKSRELYPVIAQALAEEGRWKELKEMLTESCPPVSPARVAIWLAEASSHLEPDMREASMLLKNSIAASRREENLPNLLAAATMAEKLRLLDIALEACLAAAQQGGMAALPMLQKAHDLALLQKNTAALLQITRQLHELRPGSAAYAERLSYLRLILGSEIETVQISDLSGEASGQAALTVQVERIPLPLLHALASYRLGDTSSMRQHLSGLRNTEGLPAGQRAVAAGLLSMTGETQRAFQIAEKVPAALLLEEEHAFLKKAL
jgi:tetratricopeptide (TPR) repeat protein